MRHFDSQLPAARCWRRVAILLAQELLDHQKDALLDPAAATRVLGEVARLTDQIARWRLLNDAGLVTEYTEWVRRCPELTAVMAQFARDLEAAEVRAILRYLHLTEAAD